MSPTRRGWWRQPAVLAVAPDAWIHSREPAAAGVGETA